MSQKKNKKPIKVPLREATLKRRLRRHLANMGFTKKPDGTLEIEKGGKEVVRFLHNAERNDLLHANKTFIAQHAPELLKYFAAGKDIDPANIKPKLERIKSETWQSDLFRFAALTWAVPVSNGFGRRIRYLVWDKNNDKLIGLIAIGDPVFNLSVRDKKIGWTGKDRVKRLVNVMDAYVLGAVPPYNMLLGGKLVASLVRSRDVYDDFKKLYGSSKGIISQKNKGARLLVVTTSSSLGRSSVYNRLKLDGVQYLEPIGYTGGWGHFHIPDDLFSELRNYLRVIRHKYADRHRFGQGPNWRLRTTRAALAALGLRDDLLKHGVQREVFICTLAINALSILAKGKGRPRLKGLLSAEKVAELAVRRWMTPRAERRPEYRLWTADNLKLLLKEQRLPMQSATAQA
jgi:Domain of unknown function (DUF4338)